MRSCSKPMEHSGHVQFGCGLTAPASWTNFDASPTLRIQKVPVVGGALTRKGPKFPANVRYGDVVRGLPVPPESCDAVYCSHVLEHLALEDLRTGLRNVLKCLKPGGIFRFVLPDLEQQVREYVSSTAAQPSVDFVHETLLGRRTRTRGLAAFVRDFLGNSAHLWMWDYKSLKVELEQAGFVDVRRASFGDSSDPLFRDVEERSRWDDALGIECRRPATGGR